MFSTSIFISRPTRFSRALTLNVKTSLGSLSVTPCCIARTVESDRRTSSRRERRTLISMQSGLTSMRPSSVTSMARTRSGVRVSISFAILRPRASSRAWEFPSACSSWIALRIAPSSARKLRSFAMTMFSRLAAGIRRPVGLSLADPMIRELDT